MAPREELPLAHLMLLPMALPAQWHATPRGLTRVAPREQPPSLPAHDHLHVRGLHRVPTPPPRTTRHARLLLHERVPPLQLPRRRHLPPAPLLRLLRLRQTPRLLRLRQTPPRQRLRRRLRRPRRPLELPNGRHPTRKRPSHHLPNQRSHRRRNRQLPTRSLHPHRIMHTLRQHHTHLCHTVTSWHKITHHTRHKPAQTVPNTHKHPQKVCLGG